MREGRHINDTNWIYSSIDYNRWFIENGTVSNHKIDTYDITRKKCFSGCRLCNAMGYVKTLSMKEQIDE